MEDYEVLGPIGKGSFGLVQKIKRKSDGKILVWKEMNFGKMTEREKQQLVAEVNIIRELNHPNIVRYYDRIIDKKETKIFIIMEYCECGDLGTLLKKCKKEKDYIAEDIIWKIFTQILLALNECHSRTAGKILHRDLKPANLFLDAQNNIKLGDFGLSRVMGENSVFATTHVGTPYYMSPEQIQESKYNETSDIWSAGCLLYEMAALKPPFEATNHLSLAIKIKTGKFERLPLRYSEELQQLVERMIHTDAKKRPSVGQLMDLPQVSLRLKERRLRDTHAVIKQKEDGLKKREEQMQIKLSETDEKDRLIKTQEKLLLDLQNEIRHLEITENKQVTQKRLSEIFQQPSQPPLSSKTTDYQLLSPTLTSFGKDLYGSNVPKENSGTINLQTEQGSLGVQTKNSQSSLIPGSTNFLRIEKENHSYTNSKQISSTFCAYKKEKAVQKSLIAGNKQSREVDGNFNNSEDISSPQGNQDTQTRGGSNPSNNNSSTASLTLKNKNISQQSEISDNLENNGCQVQSVNHFGSVAPNSGHNSSGSACVYSSSKKEEDSTAHSTGIKARLLSAKQDQFSDKSSGKISHESISSKQEVLLETGFDKYKARLISERTTAVRERILSTEGNDNQKSDIQQEFKQNSSKLRRYGSVEGKRNDFEQGGYQLKQLSQVKKETENNQYTSIKTPRQADSVAEFTSTQNNSRDKQEKVISQTKLSDNHSENYKEISIKQQQYNSQYSGSVIQSTIVPRSAPKLHLRPHAEPRTKTNPYNQAFTSLQQQYTSGISKPPLQPLSASEEATTLQCNSEGINEGSDGNYYIPKKTSSTNSSFSAVPTSQQTYFRTTNNYLTNQTNEQNSRSNQLCYRTSSQERKYELPLRNTGAVNNQYVSSKTRGGNSGERSKGCLTENAILNKNNSKLTQADYSKISGYKPKTYASNYSSENTQTGSSNGTRMILRQQQTYKAPPSPTTISLSSAQYKTTTTHI